MTPKKVLFLCIGNACRSQMAEGFARTYGKDVIQAASAGIAPAVSVPALTIEVMKEKNISMEDAVPKGITLQHFTDFDLIVNLSGQRRLPPALVTKTLEWPVRDPIGRSIDEYRTTRDDIENRVMGLIIALRAGRI